MNLLNDKVDMTLSTKTEMEMVQQEKQEFKLLGTYLRTSGLSLFCYNPLTGEVQLVPECEHCKTCKLVIDKDGEWTIEPLERTKIDVDCSWEYFEALNINSARRRVEKWKDGKISNLWNLRVPSKLRSIKLF